jgi:hypothetical protein
LDRATSFLTRTLFQNSRSEKFSPSAYVQATSWHVLPFERALNTCIASWFVGGNRVLKCSALPSHLRREILKTVPSSRSFAVTRNFRALTTTVSRTDVVPFGLGSCLHVPTSGCLGPGATPSDGFLSGFCSFLTEIPHANCMSVRFVSTGRNALPLINYMCNATPENS